MANPGFNGANGANGANGNRRPRIRPQFPCSECLQYILAEKLIEKLSLQIAIDDTDANTICFDIARELRVFQGIHVSAHRIKLKIMEMRKKYVSFKRFTKIPGVHYNKEDNIITVGNTYIMNHIGRETLELATFRDEGLPEFDDLHEIFRKKKFPMFGSEPSSSYVDPNEFTDSDDE